MFADAVTGLAVDVRVRRLLVHPAAGFAESGMAVSVSYDPTPSTPLGLTARFAPAWVADAMSGAEALWGRETMGGMGMAGGGMLPGGGNRLATEVGYGLPVGSLFVGTPRIGVRNSQYGRDYQHTYQLRARRLPMATPGLGRPVPDADLMPEELRAAIVLFASLLDERQRRLFAGLEALKCGWGGDRRIATLLGIDPSTVAAGRRQLVERDVEGSTGCGARAAVGRRRKKNAGSPRPHPSPDDPRDGR